MNLFVIADKETREVLMIDVMDFTTNPSEDETLGIYAAQLKPKVEALGKTLEDVSTPVFGDVKAQAYLDGHGYELEWSGSEISNIIFDMLDHLNFLKCTIDNNEPASGTVISISVESLLPDGETRDTSDQSKIKTTIQTPDGSMPITVQLVDGYKQFQYQPKPGFYAIPINKIENYRVVEIVNMECAIAF